MILTCNSHMFQDILTPKAENKNFSLQKKCKNNMVLRSSKNSSNKVSKDHQKKNSKKFKKHEIVHNLWRLLRSQQFILPYF